MRLTIFFYILCIFENAISVNQTNFKTCDQSSFCRRCRKVKADQPNFALVQGTLNTYSDCITAELINKDNKHLFILKLEALESNTFRLLIDEKTPLKARYKVEHALKSEPKTRSIKVDKADTQLTIISGSNKAVVYADPFRIDFYQNEILTVAVNSKNLMTFEYLREKQQKPAEDDENSDPGSWEEDFNLFHDSKPYGPEAVALDFSFPVAKVLFGLPEHADSFTLKSTSGTDPYRFYNVDNGNYLLNSKMALYGSVPVLYGHGSQRTAGVFWHNSAETWVDIYTAESNLVGSIDNLVSGVRKSDPIAAHFMSESGIIDVFILLGPTPLDVFKQYTSLTGTTPLPQMFALGYHQSRFTYNDDREVEDVSAKFDEYDIPMDTMWLDIDYTDDKKYFTWDQFKFPNPLAMIKNLTDLGRHLVIIIDPHIKRDTGYFFHNDCTERGLYVKHSDGRDYEGWCWPGSSSYIDFFNPEAREYYASQYAPSNFKTVTADVMFWNDMNEPSVFNGPETTMLKDLVHHGNWEHRNVHNLYGHMQVMGTFEGILKRDANQRPFILTRSHFAGSQRYALIWTGDTAADWDYFKHSIKMCLSEAVAGFSFCGADIGGFSGDPDEELYQRWYQAGAFLPFYRSHSDKATKRREPWLYLETTRLVVRDALRKRYSYLPLWYTMFYEHELNGEPIMRPLLTHYPQDETSFTVDNAFLLQDRLLVHPVMEQGVSEVNVYFPATDGQKNGDVWYDVDTLKKYSNVGYETIPVDSSKIPVFQRGGTIVPKKERIRRATLMKNDPYTLVVCLNREGKAEGTLYVDDEKTFNYRKGEYNYINFKFENNLLDVNFIGNPNYKIFAWIERVVIAGLKKVPTSATLIVNGISNQLEIVPLGEEAIAVQKPNISVQQVYNIRLNF